MHADMTTVIIQSNNIVLNEVNDTKRYQSHLRNFFDQPNAITAIKIINISMASVKLLVFSCFFYCKDT